jgi:hypothetical protein
MKMMNSMIFLPGLLPVNMIKESGTGNHSITESSIDRILNMQLTKDTIK